MKFLNYFTNVAISSIIKTFIPNYKNNTTSFTRHNLFEPIVKNNFEKFAYKKLLRVLFYQTCHQDHSTIFQ